jgi:hypothetical protein
MTAVHQKIIGTTSEGLSLSLGSLPTEPTSVSLIMDLIIDRNPPGSAVVFSSCPGSSDSLNVTIDSFRNLYLELGQIASDGGNQVIKLMEAASYGLVHRLEVRIDLDKLGATLSADGLPVTVAEARPGKVLDLGRARMLVCSPELPEDLRKNGFEGNVGLMELTLSRTSNVSSLRSLNGFLLLVVLALVSRLISSEKENKRKNHEHHAKKS